MIIYCAKRPHGKVVVGLLLSFVMVDRSFFVRDFSGEKQRLVVKRNFAIYWVPLENRSSKT